FKIVSLTHLDALIQHYSAFNITGGIQKVQYFEQLLHPFEKQPVEWTVVTHMRYYSNITNAKAVANIVSLQILHTTHGATVTLQQGDGFWEPQILTSVLLYWNPTFHQPTSGF